MASLHSKYADELGTCYGERNNLRVYLDGGKYPAVYAVGPEIIFTDNGIEYGERLEATLIGHISSLDNIEYGFDLAEEELRAYAGEAA